MYKWIFGNRFKYGPKCTRVWPAFQLRRECNTSLHQNCTRTRNKHAHAQLKWFFLNPLMAATCYICVMSYRDYLYFSVVPKSTFPVAMPYTCTSTFRYFLKSIDSLYTSPSTFVYFCRSLSLVKMSWLY
jgi:hypothetical protein